jgi:hypothetical protein
LILQAILVGRAEVVFSNVGLHYVFGASVYCIRVIFHKDMDVVQYFISLLAVN